MRQAAPQPIRIADQAIGQERHEEGGENGFVEDHGQADSTGARWRNPVPCGEAWRAAALGRTGGGWYPTRSTGRRSPDHDRRTRGITSIVTGDYLRDPALIYRRSFALIEAEAGAALAALPAELRPLARRLVHACGMTDIIQDLAWAGPVAAAAGAGLAAGRPIWCDSRMVEAGIIRRLLPPEVAICCSLDDAGVPALAASLGTTRSAAAVERWRPGLQGAIVVIGNAPTALFHLLGRLAVWPERPAAILAFPVGFVGAIEAKEALIRESHGVPFVTLKGRRGGSAMAAAAINALLEPRA